MKWINLFLLTGIFLLSSCGGPTKKSIVVAQPSGAVILDPHLQDDSTTSSLLFNIFESLTSFDHNYEIKPCLATSWQTPDDLTWVFKLRKGVFFHNGDELKTEDVVFSIKRARDDPGSKVKEYLFTVKEVSATDPRTVKITTRKPDPVLLNKLSLVSIVSKRYTLRHNEAYLSLHPVGTGPYELLEWKKDQHISLSVNHRWWGGDPYMEKAKFVFMMKEKERISALMNGSVDLITRFPVSKIDEFAKRKDYEVLHKSSLSVIFIVFNTKISPFNKVGIRRAILKGINIREILQKVYDNHHVPATQFVSPYVFGYDPDVIRPAYDPKAARKLIRESGTQADLQIILDTTQESMLTDIIKENLSRIGIKMRVNVMKPEEIYMKTTKMESSCYLLGYEATSGDAATAFLELLYGKAPNVFNYSNSEFDLLLEKALSTLKTKERLSYIREAQRIALHDVPGIPLFVTTNYYGAMRWVKWEPRPDRKIYIADIGRK